MTPRNLILITNHFPYGTGEAFLESEIQYLVGSFDKVVILTRDIQSGGDMVSDVSFVHKRINPKSDFAEMTRTAFLAMRHFKTAMAIVHGEIRYLHSRGKKFDLKTGATAFHDLFKALALSFHVRKAIKTHHLTGSVVIYSYWLTSSALASVFVKPGDITVRRIARAHRADVYESAQPGGYLSFREVLAQRLDAIYVVSSHGLDHLRNSLEASWHQKLFLSRLGTTKPPVSSPGRKSDRLVIVSCSFLSRVKRTHLIIEALSLVEDLNIEWLHFGDGPLRQELEDLSSRHLSSKKNIRAAFRGTISNSALLQFYCENNVDLFINTSSSEGIPVSIMEAQSFGIPVVAMSVGGVSEIVSQDTGILLDDSDAPERIAMAVRTLLMLPEEQKQRLRMNALNNWETNYNAEKNFSTFVAEILKL